MSLGIRKAVPAQTPRSNRFIGFWVPLLQQGLSSFVALAELRGVASGNSPRSTGLEGGATVGTAGHAAKGNGVAVDEDNVRKKQEVPAERKKDDVPADFFEGLESDPKRPVAWKVGNRAATSDEPSQDVPDVAELGNDDALPEDLRELVRRRHRSP
jgi:hypothetical protein